MASWSLQIVTKVMWFWSFIEEPFIECPVCANYQDDPPEQTRYGLSLGWLGSIPGLSGSKAHDLPPHCVLSHKILLVEGTGRPAPSPSLLWCSDFLGSLTYSWVFCNFQFWSPGQSTVLYSCFLQALLPLTISNAKTWKILSIWWKPGLNVRHFAAF